MLETLDVVAVDEAERVDPAAVPRYPRRIGSIAVVLAGHWILASGRGTLELVAKTGDDAAPLLLPHYAPVPARAGRACGVINELLEVVGVGPAAFFHADLSASGVWVAIVPGKVAPERVLAPEGELAHALAVEADPRIAIEDGVVGVESAGLEQ